MIAASILVVSLIAILLWIERGGTGAGPSYQGKTLRRWIDAMDSLNPSVHTQAVASVRSIGTNALPTLIKWMAHQDSDHQRRFYELLRSRKVVPHLQSALMSNSEVSCEYRAMLGFYALGQQARSALPFLERLVRDDSASPAKRQNAARAYVYVAPTQAERLAMQWSSSTNQNLISSGGRLMAALLDAGITISSSNELDSPNDGPARAGVNSDASGEGRHR